MSREHSIWLVPTGEARLKLARIIADVSREYSAPLFPPHVTLIGQLKDPEEELLNKARDLASRLRPFELKLGAVDYLDDFYRSLFVRIEKTQPLLDANRIAREIFGQAGDASYMPHASLLYGNFEPVLKDQVIARIGREFHDSFIVTSIVLYETGSATKDWYSLGEFTLNHIGDTLT
jgi:2'-5' RNA ligase